MPDCGNPVRLRLRIFDYTFYSLYLRPELNDDCMLILLGFLFGGVLTGYLLRRWRITWTGKVTMALIWLLLFLLGVEVGCNRELIRSLPTLGAEAALIAVVCALGSCLAAMLLWRWTSRSEQRPKAGPDADMTDAGTSGGGDAQASVDSRKTVSEEDGAKARSGALKDSLIIIAFFVAGILLGVSDVLPVDMSQTGVAMYALYALILSVGFSVGNNPEIIGGFKRLNPRLALLPLMTVLGTLAAAALLGLLVPHRTVPEMMAVGSGFAYYSLSSVLITEYIGAGLGTVALISNICREFLTLILAPVLVRWFGPLAPISCGGATTMDVTLPSIIQASGEKYTVLSMFHGFVVDFSVPFLVTFFCSL